MPDSLLTVGHSYDSGSVHKHRPSRAPKFGQKEGGRGAGGPARLDSRPPRLDPGPAIQAAPLGGGGVAAPPSRPSQRRRRGVWRRSDTCWAGAVRAEAMPVAMAAADGLFFFF